MALSARRNGASGLTDVLPQIPACPVKVRYVTISGDLRDGEILLSCRESAGAWVEREGESVNKIGIIAKPRPDAKPLLEDLVKWLEARGLEPVLDIDTAAILGDASTLN